jgi:hypothetical protein
MCVATTLKSAIKQTPKTPSFDAKPKQAFFFSK